MFSVKTITVATLVSAALGASAAGAQPLVPPARRLAPPVPSISGRAGAASVTASSSAIGVASSDGMSASVLSVYTPPACVPGVPFADITCTTGFDPWIEQFGLDGITAGCGGGNYCPGSTVTRDQMAVFIEKAMHGAGNWPPHTVLVYHHPAGESSSDQNSGTELLNLVGAIPGGPETPSGSNPWLVKLGPGTFDLGSSTLDLPAWVSMEGSGLEETVITSATSGLAVALSVGSGVTTLTRLTVRNFGGSGTGVYAIQMNGGRLVLDRAQAYALGSATFQVGIYAADSAIEMYNESVVLASGNTSFGIYTQGSQFHALTVDHSIVEGLSNAIYNTAGYEVDMAYDGVFDSALANFGAGVYKCIGNYDRNMVAVSCP
jgi:hypothetical protein